MKRSLYFLTGARSEFDYFTSLYREAEASGEFLPAFLVSGMHLAPGFGNSVHLIEEGGYRIAGVIDNLLASDRPASRGKSAAHLLQGLMDMLSAAPPDFLVVVGDREEAMMGALAGAYLRIPVVQIAAGDHADDGNVDNAVRHAASKLAHLHFCLTQKSADRLIAMGEEPWRVHVTGSPSLERFVTTPSMADSDLWQALDHDPGDDPVIVVIQHPILGDEENAERHMTESLEAVRRLGLPAFVSAPNSDTGHSGVIRAIKAAAGDNPRLHAYQTLDNTLFVNLMRRASVLLGNSSAGLIEAPFLKLPAVNVGLRQRGREHGETVQFVEPDRASIETALQRALYDQPYKSVVTSAPSLYGEGDAARRMVAILTDMADKDRLLFKRHLDKEEDSQ